ncbi:MFS transporter [Bifidobacterium vansinderenii]|uniref:Oligogalacturonide transporter n=1 Tax=Bifidobacterium vansinderenii TaxID=1984871 RepID=A0A229VW30_9BIFI|nr:MFS transporter [Bifidobacterium vansinderenii]OXM99822.1 oligogalacturonide transporter [Bifidobacterium vansinderenii]
MSGNNTMNYDLTGKVPLLAKFGFSMLPLAWVTQTMVVTWQMFYFTTFVKMSVMMVTLMLTVGKVVGAFATPFWGYLSDRLYRTAFGRKFGRRRAVLLLCIPLNFIFYMGLWIMGMPTWFYFLVNILYWAAWAGVTTVQYALPAEMTENTTQRAQIVGINQIAGAIGGTSLSMLNIWLFTLWGKDNWTAYFYIALLWGIVGTIALFIGFLTVQERPYDASTDVASSDSSNGEASGLKRFVGVFWNFLSAMRVKSYRVYLGMYICEQTFRAIRGTINTYFVMFVLLLDPQTVSLGTGVGFIFGMAFVAMWIWLTAKLDGMRTFRLGGYACILAFACMLGLGIFHASVSTGVRATLFVVFLILMNFGISGVVNATQFVFTLVPDVDEIVTAKRREGQYAGINSTLDVIFTALETLLIGAVLSWTGFVEGATTQPAATVDWIMILYTVVPVVLVILGNIVSRLLKMTSANHKKVLAEVTRLRNGGDMKDVDAETKKVVEELSGFKYEQCWGHNNVIDATNKA